MADSSVLLIEGQKKHEQILHQGQDMYICRHELVGPDRQHKDDREGRRRGEDSGVSAITEISPAQRQFTTHSPSISQRHAVLSLSSRGKFLVKDLDSTNGTWLRLTPHQVYELPENFELLLAKDLVVQRRTPLWETTPEIGRFANGEDFAAYVRSQLSNYVSTVRIYGKDSPEVQRDNQLCTKLPLLAQPCNPEPSYLVVTWRLNTFNLALERWLQSCVFLFNSGPVGDPSPLRDEKPWQFVAASPARRHVLKLAQRVAQSTTGTVLLCGSSGAGKEVLARDLHLHSSRAKKPFIAVNCAALPADLIEAELFGTRRGAFTNAVDRIGLFERARDGTLFLDEIGELPLNLQAKLLRALDQKVIRCVGDTEERPIKARIIAATNRNLEKMVAAGTFRDDLRFRLVAVQLPLPDLQPSDVSALVPHLCETLVDEGFAELSEETVQILSQLAAKITWSGNARELRSALERYLTFRDPASTVEENWKKALESSWPLTQSGGLTPPAQTEQAVQLPETLGLDCERLQNLLFLSVARRVLIPDHWGSLKELGDKMGMTGAGAAARLRRLAITTDPEPSAAQIDAEIANLKAELQPRMPLLRSLLGL